jgi:putative addiction module component (TIGR02574 family)
MTMGVEQLEAEALALPRHDRIRLVERLIESLDTDEDEDSAEVERAWEAEIRRRLEEFDIGAAQAIPFEDLLAQLRQRMR